MKVYDGGKNVLNKSEAELYRLLKEHEQNGIIDIEQVYDSFPKFLPWTHRVFEDTIQRLLDLGIIVEEEPEVELYADTAREYEVTWRRGEGEERTEIVKAVEAEQALRIAVGDPAIKRVNKIFDRDAPWKHGQGWSVAEIREKKEEESPQKEERPHMEIGGPPGLGERVLYVKRGDSVLHRFLLTESGKLKELMNLSI